MHDTKLTFTHVYSGPFKIMKVRLAAKVFSSNIAAGVSTALNCRISPATSINTIHFIHDIDKLFNIFNSADIPNSEMFNSFFRNILPQTDHLI